MSKQVLRNFNFLGTQIYPTHRGAVSIRAIKKFEKHTILSGVGAKSVRDEEAGIDYFTPGTFDTTAVNGQFPVRTQPWYGVSERAFTGDTGAGKLRGTGEEDNIDYALKVIAYEFGEANKQNAKGEYVVNISGYSRGGASGIRFANEIYNIYGNRIKVNLFLADPNAGAGRHDSSRKTNIPPNVQNAYFTFSEKQPDDSIYISKGLSQYEFMSANTCITALGLPGTHQDQEIIPKPKKGEKEQAPLAAQAIQGFIEEFFAKHGAERIVTTESHVASPSQTTSTPKTSSDSTSFDDSSQYSEPDETSDIDTPSIVEKSLLDDYSNNSDEDFNIQIQFLSAMYQTENPTEDNRKLFGTTEGKEGNTLHATMNSFVPTVNNSTFKRDELQQWRQTPALENLRIEIADLSNAIDKMDATDLRQEAFRDLRSQSRTMLTELIKEFQSHPKNSPKVLALAKSTTELLATFNPEKLLRRNSHEGYFKTLPPLRPHSSDPNIFFKAAKDSVSNFEKTAKIDGISAGLRSLAGIIVGIVTGIIGSCVLGVLGFFSGGLFIGAAVGMVKGAQLGYRSGDRWASGHPTERAIADTAQKICTAQTDFFKSKVSVPKANISTQKPAVTSGTAKMQK